MERIESREIMIKDLKEKCVAYSRLKMKIEIPIYYDWWMRLDSIFTFLYACKK